MAEMIRTAMIFAAGLGTRLKPFTDKHPKALAVVNGSTLLERNILYLKMYGINRIVVNVHHFADQIIDFLEKKDHFGIDTIISDEQSELLETGGGLVKAKAYLQNDTDFIVMNADMLTDLNLNALIQSHRANNPIATLAVMKRNSSRQFLFDAQMQLSGWQNNDTGEQVLVNNHFTLPYAFSGIHIASSRIFQHLPKEGKFSVIKPYLEIAKTHGIFGFDHSGGILLDVGKPEALIKAEQLFK
jgi:N-acetyl-alpha-D-muramate 1-phosphate uridylyltransferase